MQELHSPAAAAAWLRQHVRGTLHSDSRKVAPGDGFLAWPGAAHDARAHVPAALAQGAAACLVERAGAERFELKDARVAGYTGLRSASALVASAYFDAPSHALRVVAVTGTNGKTSTAWWLAQALSNPLIDPPLAVRNGRHPGHRPATGPPARTPHSQWAADRHRPDDTRSGVAAVQLAPVCRRLAARLRARSIVDRHRRTPARRHPDPYRRVHQFHAGPSGLPRLDAGLLDGQDGAVRVARPGRSGGQHRRRQG